MDEIELSKVSKFIVEEVTNLPAEFSFGDIECIVYGNETKTRFRYFTKYTNRHRIFSFYSWFLRSSWLKKVDILKRFAWCTTNLHTLILVLNTIYTATCKDYIYSTYQGLNLFTCDKILNDNNRTLDMRILNDVIQNETKWFRKMNDYEQYYIILELIQLADSCIIGKIFFEFLIIFKSRYREIYRVQYLEELRLRPPSTATTQKSKRKDTKVKMEKMNKKGKTAEDEAARLEKEKEIQRLKDLEEINVFLNENFPDTSQDPNTIELISIMQKWDTFMTTYKKKVGLGPPKKVSKKNDKPKKGKKQKEKISKDLPDDVQLLPIWINKNLVASVDPKTLNKATATNKYWNFLAKGIKEDIKCRKSLNKNCEKLKRGLKIVEIKSIIPPAKLAGKFVKTAEVTDTTIRSSFYTNHSTTDALQADLYRACATYITVGTALQAFPRNIYIPECSSINDNRAYIADSRIL